MPAILEIPLMPQRESRRSQLGCRALEDATLASIVSYGLLWKICYQKCQWINVCHHSIYTTWDQSEQLFCFLRVWVIAMNCVDINLHFHTRFAVIVENTDSGWINRMFLLSELVKDNLNAFFISRKKLLLVGLFLLSFSNVHWVGKT